LLGVAVTPNSLLGVTATPQGSLKPVTVAEIVFVAVLITDTEPLP
jgi:hypothetical protein